MQLCRFTFWIRHTVPTFQFCSNSYFMRSRVYPHAFSLTTFFFLPFELAKNKFINAFSTIARLENRFELFIYRTFNPTNFSTNKIYFSIEFNNLFSIKWKKSQLRVNCNFCFTFFYHVFRFLCRVIICT